MLRSRVVLCREFIRFIVAVAVLVSAASAWAQGYRVERIASGLAQPTYVTQAPGDPSNIIYYSTRITAASGTGGGFGTINNMGGIFRYDMNTGVSTQIMNLSYRQLTGDEGLESFAFSPDFNTPGAPGYQKLYVTSSQYNNGASADRARRRIHRQRPQRHRADRFQRTCGRQQPGAAVQQHQHAAKSHGRLGRLRSDCGLVARGLAGAELPVHHHRRRRFGRQRTKSSGTEGQQRSWQGAACRCRREGSWRCLSHRHD